MSTRVKEKTMGLFDIFKKKELSHDEKVASAYGSYNQDKVRGIFPGGKNQASDIIRSLASIYGINYDTADASTYLEILHTYSDTVIRRIVTQSNDEHIMMSLQVKHKSLVTDKEKAKQVLAYVVLNMNNNSFALNTDKDWDALNDRVEMYNSIEKTAKENVVAEKSNLDDPEYGLVVNKPIYTQGVMGSRQYLGRLKTDTGEELTWERIGSTSAEGINGMIDIYTSKFSSGKPYKTLYINMYGSSNSEKVPAGFIKQDIVDYFSNRV